MILRYCTNSRKRSPYMGFALFQFLLNFSKNVMKRKSEGEQIALYLEILILLYHK